MRTIILSCSLLLIPLQLHAQIEPFGLEGMKVTSLTIY